MARTPGTPAAWEHVLARLVAERGDALVRYARLLCGDQDDAVDLVQDALVKTFGRLRSGYELDSAEAYVRRSILTTYLDGGRRVTRWRRIRHLQAEPDLQPSRTTETDGHLDMMAELRRLAPRERACVVLRYYEDRKVDEIAAALGISSGAVKRYLSDALAKLRVRLGDERDPARPEKGLGHAR